MNERPAKDFSIGKAQVRVLVTGEQTGKRYAVTESVYPPGSGLGKHKHLGFDETNIVIDGALQGEVAGRPFRSRPGEVLQIAKGTLHTVENASLEHPVTFISIYSPSGMDEYFAKMASGLQSGQLAHGGREALQKEYGIVFEGPFFTQRRK
jgi:quercetin dioxygenase-like cupin family protein